MLGMARLMAVARRSAVVSGVEVGDALDEPQAGVGVGLGFAEVFGDGGAGGGDGAGRDQPGALRAGADFPDRRPGELAVIVAHVEHGDVVGGGGDAGQGAGGIEGDGFGAGPSGEHPVGDGVVVVGVAVRPAGFAGVGDGDGDVGFPGRHAVLADSDGGGLLRGLDELWSYSVLHFAITIRKVMAG
jgi:hypothetical protein